MKKWFPLNCIPRKLSLRNLYKLDQQEYSNTQGRYSRGQLTGVHSITQK